MAAKTGSTGLRFVTERSSGTFTAQVNRKKITFCKNGFKTAQEAYDYAVQKIEEAGGRISQKVNVSGDEASAAKDELDGPKWIQFDCKGCGYSQATIFERCPKCSGFAIERIEHGDNQIKAPDEIEPPSATKTNRKVRKTRSPSLPTAANNQIPPMPPVKPPAPDHGDRHCLECCHRAVCRIRDQFVVRLTEILREIASVASTGNKYSPTSCAVAANKIIAGRCGHYQAEKTPLKSAAKGEDHAINGTI